MSFHLKTGAMPVVALRVSQ